MQLNGFEYTLDLEIQNIYYTPICGSRTDVGQLQKEDRIKNIKNCPTLISISIS